MDFFTLECECDGVSMSAKRCDKSDSVVLGDSSLMETWTVKLQKPSPNTSRRVMPRHVMYATYL